MPDQIIRSAIADDRIMSTDSPDLLNTKLHKYGATLFDFAYYLATALNGQFYSKYYLGRTYREIANIQSILSNIEKKLAPYDLLSDLLRQVIDKHKELSRAIIPGRKGIPLDNKTQVILLWTQYLKKERMGCRWKFSYKDDLKQSIKPIRVKGLVSVIDWDAFYRLLKWFYNRLEECVYSKCIHPKQDKNKEERNSKLRLNMSMPKYCRSVSIAYSHYEQVQEYFRNKSRGLPIIITWDGFLFSNAYPIIKINFNKDNIVIGELREKGIMLEKYMFAENGSVIKEAPRTNKHGGIKTPCLIFPDGAKFTG